MVSKFGYAVVAKVRRFIVRVASGRYSVRMVAVRFMVVRHGRVGLAVSQIWRITVTGIEQKMQFREQRPVSRHLCSFSTRGEDTIEFFETFGEVGRGVEPHRIADFIDAAVVFGQHLRGPRRAVWCGYSRWAWCRAVP